MANVGIDHVKVFEIAAKLEKEGKEPTIQAIREVLGTGSFTTISNILKHYRNEKQKTGPIPQAPQVVELALSQLWGAAWKEAQNLIEAERGLLRSEREKWESEREALLSEIKKVEDEEHDAKKKVQGLEKMLENERTRYSNLEKFLKESEGRVLKLDAKLEASEAQRKEDKERADRLEKELAEIARGKSKE